MFPTEIPRGLILTDSYGDAVTEVSVFRDIPWNSVTPALLAEKFEAPYFFSALALCYYLPAYIYCSVIDISRVLLPVNTLLGLLSHANNSEWEQWRRQRWELLSPKQWIFVEHWVDWLLMNPKAECLSNLQTANDAVRRRVWGNGENREE